MTDDPLDPLLPELTWRQDISPEEQARLRAWLAAHPEAQADWEAEASLNEALDRLPDVPVATNFTARVLQTVERETQRQERGRASIWRRWGWRWLPKAAVAALVLGGGFHLYQQRQHQEIANNLVAVSEATTAPLDPEVFPQVLEDFDTIRALNQTSPDQQLLTLLGSSE
ncbi:MAG TPA: hypothetical protein VN578_07075 [Candidatus Binatia bacterium]|jgi:anti-sigma factor RsiW|nr:hypothetical protein [Candidatus Binatia bacterium]